jgi:hypothetical protein
VFRATAIAALAFIDRGLGTDCRYDLSAFPREVPVSIFE